MSDEKFDLWLEFEHWGPAGAHGPEDDFFNMKVRLPDGRCYALNVWTFKFLERARREDVETGEGLSGKYMLPPDLFVERLERELVTQTIADLIRRRRLKDEWLVRDS